MNSTRAKIGVLVTGKGRGSTFRNFLEAQRTGILTAPIAVLIATDEAHGAVDFAREHNIPLQVLAASEFPDAQDWETRALEVLREHEISLLALAGFMRLIGPRILNQWHHRIVNVHPSLLPSFGGQGMFGQRVHQAVIAHGCKVSGATVHLIDERFDNGPIVAQRCVGVEENDSIETLAARVQAVEKELYPQVLEQLARGGWRVEGRRVLGLNGFKNTKDNYETGINQRVG